jgi:hypothetical protein
MRLTEAAPLPVFHQAISPARTRSASSNKVSSEAIEEINAYIAVRDQSLAEAERVPTRSTVDRALLANEFVESCLRPTRSPYQAQGLTEAHAADQRQRCAAAKARLAQLNARVSDVRCAAAA